MSAEKIPLAELRDWLFDETLSAKKSADYWEAGGHAVPAAREREKMLRSAHTIIGLVSKYENEVRSLVSQLEARNAPNRQRRAA